jgi:hypothetical protein
MGRDDQWICGWIGGDAAHHAGYGKATGVPGTGWTTAWGDDVDEVVEDEADEDDWPDDGLLDDEWLDGEPFAAPGGPAGPGFGYREGGWGHGGVPRFSAWTAIAVAVVAAVAGVAAGFFLIRGTPETSAAGTATPSASAPAPSGIETSLPARPGLPGNASGNASGNGQLRMLLTGRVLAVSGTSITIGGAGPSVTAAITGATRITGSVHGIGGVKTGDEVAAQITGTPSHLVITALQDPAQ